METGNNQELIRLNRSACNPLMTASSPHRKLMSGVSSVSKLVMLLKPMPN
jgi:hypothetical protein